jgi:predicted ATPase with chaperone activity
MAVERGVQNHPAANRARRLLARALPTILPALTLPEALEVTRIHSTVGLLFPTRH